MTQIAARLVVGFDLAGTALFAVEGARTAIGAGLDALGVVSLAFVTALAGGIVRDVLIGDSPPAALRDWRYSFVAIAGGALAFIFHAQLASLSGSIGIALDAAGLGLFAVAGAQKTVAAGLHPLIAIAMSGVTGAGGGVLRDMLLARVPVVLHADVYATAALAGGAVMLLFRRYGMSQLAANSLGAAACVALRMLAVIEHWNLPAVRPP